LLCYGDKVTGGPKIPKLATQGLELHSMQTGRPGNFLVYPLARAIGLRNSELSEGRVKGAVVKRMAAEGEGKAPERAERVHKGNSGRWTHEPEAQRTSLRNCGTSHTIAAA
jgi:hypothetical protein